MVEMLLQVRPGMPVVISRKRSAWSYVFPAWRSSQGRTAAISATSMLGILLTASKYRGSYSACSRRSPPLKAPMPVCVTTAMEKSETAACSSSWSTSHPCFDSSSGRATCSNVFSISDHPCGFEVLVTCSMPVAGFVAYTKSFSPEQRMSCACPSRQNTGSSSRSLTRKTPAATNSIFSRQFRPGMPLRRGGIGKGSMLFIRVCSRRGAKRE
mmetsp:Transcript_24382/g.65071  ORF Transcript_24382/g.65071 Transcript_24382/m.65071 type:complete len:212 (-) Transcript_24382:54-689(-)